MTTNSTISSLLFGVILLACVERPLAVDATGDGGSSTSGSGGASSGVPTSTGQSSGTELPPGTTTGAGMGPGTGTGPDTGTTSSAGSGTFTSEESGGFISGGTGTGDTDCGFVCDTQGAGPCDLFGQDCPEGAKCTLVSEGGGWWSGTKCVPVTGDGQPGDACLAIDPGSGLDDCAEGKLCWDLDVMDQGICVEPCSTFDPVVPCTDPNKFGCVVLSEGFGLCYPGCDPLIQDCPPEDVCIPSGDLMVCVPDASGAGGQVFDPCEFANACDAGLLCLNPSAAIECDANAGGCCMPFCDLSDPNVVCPGSGVSCVSLYEEGMAPPQYVEVGICVVPE